MTIFARVWSSLSAFFDHLWADNGAAIEAWGDQFLTDIGQVIFADTAEYGVQIYNGTLTITDAFTKVLADLKTKGLADIEQFAETIFNALRTHTNLAATNAVANPTLASTDAASTVTGS